MEGRGRLLRSHGVALVLGIILFIPLFAFAGGGQQYPNGVDIQLIGVAPPPGFYIKDYNYWYTASKLKDDNGNTIKLATHGVQLDDLDVVGTIPRFIYISKFNILGGFWGMHLFTPLLNEDLKLAALTPGGIAEPRDRRGGVGNFIFDPLIWSYHSKGGLLHITTGLDMFLPTGPYRNDHLINVGKNFWTFEPVFAITAFLPQHPNLSGSIKLMYDFNTTNNDFIIDPTTAAKIGNPALTGVRTHLTPGQEFHFDWGFDYAVLKNLRLGVGGYFYQQTTKDKTGHGTVEHDLGRVFAIGPGVWFNYQRWFLELHTAWEMAVKNRPQGMTGLFNITYCF